MNGHVIYQQDTETAARQRHGTDLVVRHADAVLVFQDVAVPGDLDS